MPNLWMTGRDTVTIVPHAFGVGKKLYLEVEAIKEYNEYLDIAVKLYMSDY